jgi:cytochrome c oxidase cbb3-type subunit 3
MQQTPRLTVTLGFVLALSATQGCTSDSRAAEAMTADAASSEAAPLAAAGHLTDQDPVGQRASPPANAAGRFVSHPGHIQPGLVKPYAGLALRNPYANDPNARALGAKLFISYNCADCHGAEGSGFMAPTLQDGRWHFGGSDQELFESIYEGRPDGMPAWGSLIADDQIWMLVSYVRTLQGNRTVTTENFTGRTVERMGH